MPRYIYSKPKDGKIKPFVKIEAEDGEELTETQALILILDQIDTRLFDIAAAAERLG